MSCPHGIVGTLLTLALFCCSHGPSASEAEKAWGVILSQGATDTEVKNALAVIGTRSSTRLSAVEEDAVVALLRNKPDWVRRQCIRVLGFGEREPSYHALITIALSSEADDLRSESLMALDTRGIEKRGAALLREQLLATESVRIAAAIAGVLWRAGELDEQRIALLFEQASVTSAALGILDVVETYCGPDESLLRALDRLAASGGDVGSKAKGVRRVLLSRK